MWKGLGIGLFGGAALGVSALAQEAPVVVLDPITIEAESDDILVQNGYVAQSDRIGAKADTPLVKIPQAISVVTQGLALSAHFGDGQLRPADVAAGIVGAVVKDPVADRVVWNEYLEAVAREREDWGEFYAACREESG